MKVIILGCGPAGLLAAHAANQAALDVTVYSRKQKSEMPGAQFLHAPIEGVTSAEPDANCFFIKKGSKTGYAAKVYGDPDVETSWSKYPEGERPIWSMRAAYDSLWEQYADQVLDCAINDEVVIELQLDFPDALIISTIPAPLICSNPAHLFKSRPIWIRVSQTSVDTNCVVYNGDPMIGYYRASTLFGWESAEFGHAVPMAVRGEKPMSHTCDCHPGVHRLGRFGRWERGVLVNHAYDTAKQLVVDHVEDCSRGRRYEV